MTTLKAILDECSAAELRSATALNRVSAEGNKKALVATLTSRLTATRILKGLSNTRLKATLASIGLPTSGNKNQMVIRIVRHLQAKTTAGKPASKVARDAVEVAQQKKTSQVKGQEFETRVENWLNRKFDIDNCKRNQKLRGKLGAQTFEVDIVAWCRDKKVLLVECKNRTSKITRDDIYLFARRAHEVKEDGPGILLELVQRRTVQEWTDLMFVSKSSFNQGAIETARDSNIACYEYDGKRFLRRD